MEKTTGEQDRRAAVLDSAMLTFARFGYRKTSMDEVARAAHISRPGLYFLFDSKEALFRAAVTQTLELDLARVERALSDESRPLRERVVEAFDHWAGRYIGPLASDVPVVIDDNPHLLGEIARTAPERFAQLITKALGDDRAQTLISVSIGLKHQLGSREVYLERMGVAVSLLVG